MNEIILSRIHPDYAQIRAQMQLALKGFDTWKDLLPTATGQAAIDFVAAIGDLDQYSIEHAYKEGFLDARKSSSVYAIAKLLGVRLGRKSPASASVTLSRTNITGSLTIPAYTEFNAAGIPLFNRVPITFNIGVTSVTATLFEGTVKSVAALSDGTDYQLFVATEQEFTISDQDVQVFAAGLPVVVSHSGLWNQKGERAVQDLTYSRGEMVLMFGNSEFGYKPPLNTPLTFRYVITAGASGNSSTFNGQTLTCPSVPAITGIANSGLAGGAEQRDAAFYRRFGPQLFSASEKANTEDEYQAVAVNFPSVVDALVVGQRKLSPTRNEYMNLVRVSLLRNSTWGTPQFQAFDTYYKDRTMFPVRFYYEDPTAVPVDIEANVYCRREGDLQEIQNAVTAAVQELFAPRVGIIGLNFFKSDIYEAIRLSSLNVEFVELITPVTDVYPMFQAVRPPQISQIDGGGTLSGKVAYAVTVRTSAGETLADNIGTQNLSPNSAALIQWASVPGALGYNIYGRDFPNAKLLAQLPANVNSFTDIGFALGTTPVPDFDTSGVRYCKLGNLKLNMFYTSRRT